MARLDLATNFQYIYDRNGKEILINIQIPNIYLLKYQPVREGTAGTLTDRIVCNVVAAI